MNSHQPFADGAGMGQPATRAMEREAALPSKKPPYSLKRIVIDLDPVSVGVLQVYLFYLVGPELGGAAVLRPVAVFYVRLVQVFGKSLHGRDAKSEVDIYIMRDIFLCSGNHMQLAMFGDLEPDMLAVMKRFGYFLELQHFFIEIPRAVQVRHKDGLVAEMRPLGMGAQGQQERGGKQHN